MLRGDIKAIPGMARRTNVKFIISKELTIDYVILTRLFKKFC